jgi:hypothetical protein
LSGVLGTFLLLPVWYSKGLKGQINQLLKAVVFSFLSAVMKDRRVLVESGSDNAKRIDKDDDGLDNNQNAGLWHLYQQ